MYSNLELQFGGGGIQRGARHLNGLSVVVTPLLKWYPVSEKVKQFFKQELFYNYCSVTPEHTWFKSLVMISMSSSLINYNNVLDILSKWYNTFYFMKLACMTINSVTLNIELINSFLIVIFSSFLSIFYFQPLTFKTFYSFGVRSNNKIQSEKKYCIKVK